MAKYANATALLLVGKIQYVQIGNEKYHFPMCEQEYGLPTHNQNEQQRFNFNVLTHDVMGKWCWRRELVSLYKHQPDT